ncbi:MAG: glycosyltransferase family 9 protein [Chthoniobacterales bacterium]
MHYVGDRPCRPHIESGHRCTCVQFQEVKRRGVIIKLGAAGDVLRSTPLLRALSPFATGTKILWITHSPELIPAEACEAVRPTAATLARVGAAPWDFCWNLDKDADACTIAAMTKATEHRGYTLRNGVPYPADQAAWHKFATGIDDPYSRANKQSYVEEVFDIVGLPYGKEEYWLSQPGPEAHARAMELLPKRGAIGLNIGAGKRWPSRIWPVEYWIELINLLRARGLAPVLLGGPEEVEMSARLVADTDCMASGVQPLEVFYAMIAQCQCVVTAVTMAMHLAIGARTPLVLINNIFNPHEFELYGRGEVIGPSTPCDCYYSGVCKTGRRCINEILPGTVFEAVLRSIEPARNIEKRAVV